MAPIPTGTVTFLFTDIEGSTQLWERHPDAMERALAHHDAILRQLLTAHRGYVFKTVGDAFYAAFTSALDALDAALDIQRSLRAESWGATPIKVRAALHTGSAQQREGDYFGPPLNRVARLMAAGHGEQILLSAATHDRVRNALPLHVELRDLGERRLKDLVRPEHIFQVVADDLDQDFAPLKTLDARPNNLPVQLTSFIGRAREMADVNALVPTTHLLTLTGTGGAGKTRLALQVAADWIDDFDHGVWFVELASLADPSLLPQTVAAACGLAEQPRRPILNTLLDFARDKNFLLILDNCEHLIEACARLIEQLLGVAPGLRVLATSREPLNIAGETVYHVPSLEMPDPRNLPAVDVLADCESVHLFCDRAQAARPGFELTRENAPVVVQICARLDGIPLAIELAAACIRTLSATEIAGYLDDRFRILAGNRTALPRRQTLQGAIDWSYDLLSSHEKIMFERLSIFSGGWTMDAAEAVCDKRGIDSTEVLDLVTQLVEKSLVVAESLEGTTRYRMLETILHYARRKLAESGEEEWVHGQHLAYYIRQALEIEPRLHGPEQSLWIQRIAQEHENFRAALTWSYRRGDAEPTLRLAGALWWYWFRSEHLTEGSRWLTEATAMEQAHEYPRALAPVLTASGALSWQRGDYAAARAALEEGIALAKNLQGDSRVTIAHALPWLCVTRMRLGDLDGARVVGKEGIAVCRELNKPYLLANALYCAGRAALESGDLETAHVHIEESCRAARAANDTTALALALGSLGLIATHREDYVAARAIYMEALSMREATNDRLGRAATLVNLAEVEQIEGNFKLAADYYEASLEISRELGGLNDVARCLRGAGRVAQHRCEVPQARALLIESLDIYSRLQSLRGIAECLGDLAAVIAAQGQPCEAAVVLGASDVLLLGTGRVRWPADAVELRRSMTGLRAQLSDSVLGQAWAEGRTLSMEQAIARARRAVALTSASPGDVLNQGTAK